ncbi:HAD-IA family hydrolase [Paenibacillus rhizovicinus]|uniref:HAD-IA family hydrolase n=1 Tax=Paenibacillus rhizovicinus TaxID=2704463 RepID=A0A6C0NYL7_9BACL|nr:HAD-IA family hydrolase [Paenibacillus rhizovicinus]QHW31221.1 HAD-IA family hydrolase [Paenibacillus rhizovicinus]
MKLLWDFDGTLFDTYPVYTDVLYEVLAGASPKREILSRLKVSFTHAVRHYGLSEAQIRRIFELEEALHPAQTPPFPDVEHVLKFAEVNVIMTHKPRKEVMAILQHYGLAEYFKEIVAGDDGYPKKPDPASYLYLHGKHQLDLAIGDREIDILPAKAIGMQTCLFQNPTPVADFYLTHYKDFFKKITGGNL